MTSPQFIFNCSFIFIFSSSSALFLFLRYAIITSFDCSVISRLTCFCVSNPSSCFLYVFILFLISLYLYRNDFDTPDFSATELKLIFCFCFIITFIVSSTFWNAFCLLFSILFNKGPIFGFLFAILFLPPSFNCLFLFLIWVIQIFHHY